MMNYIICLLASLMMPASMSASAADSVISRNIHDLAEEIITEWGIPGMAVSVVKDGDMIMCEGFGVKKLGGSDSVRSNTLFHVGSISKSFTGTVMASVVDDGLVRWDERVEDILPDFVWGDAEAGHTLLVKDLFTHHTGLCAQVGTYIPNLGYDREDILEMFRYIKPLYPKGSRFAYNNITYIVAAKIIEQVTGKSWEENVYERVFRPLGMSSSRIGGEEYLEAGDDAASAHMLRYQKVPGATARAGSDMKARMLTGENRALHWVSVIGPAGGICSTAEDLAKYVTCHLLSGGVPSFSFAHSDTAESLSNSTASLCLDTSLSCFMLPQSSSKHSKLTLLTSSRPQNTPLLRPSRLPDTLLNTPDENRGGADSDETPRTIIAPPSPDTLTSATAATFNSSHSPWQVVSPEGMEVLHSGPCIRSDSTMTRCYGCGWYVEHNTRYDVIYHTGTTWGFTALCGFFPEFDVAFCVLCDAEVSQNARFPIMRRLADLCLMEKEGKSEDELEDYCREWKKEWIAKQGKDSRRAVPCTIRKSSVKPSYESLVGHYSKPAPFGDAEVTMKGGRLYLTIGPQGWTHELQHSSGNMFLLTSQGHTFPIYFHGYETPGGKVDFEIDFNYNENFGPWIRN